MCRVPSRRRGRRTPSLAHDLVAIALTVLIVAVGLVWASTRRPSDAPQRGPIAGRGGAVVDASSPSSTAASRRPVFNHSVVRGGLYSRAEAIAAVERDAVVATHYRDIAMDELRVERVPATRSVFVSYRVGDRVSWTRRPVVLHAGEWILSDGRHAIRARCGNRISDDAVAGVAIAEPWPGELDAVEGGRSVAALERTPSLTGLARSAEVAAQARAEGAGSDAGQWSIYLPFLGGGSAEGGGGAVSPLDEPHVDATGKTIAPGAPVGTGSDDGVPSASSPDVGIEVGAGPEPRAATPPGSGPGARPPGATPAAPPSPPDGTGPGGDPGGEGGSRLPRELPPPHGDAGGDPHVDPPPTGRPGVDEPSGDPPTGHGDPDPDDTAGPPPGGGTWNDPPDDHPPHPIPEPGTLLLLVTGVGAVARRRARRTILGSRHTRP